MVIVRAVAFRWIFSYVHNITKTPWSSDSLNAVKGPLVPNNSIIKLLGSSFNFLHVEKVKTALCYLFFARPTVFNGRLLLDKYGKWVTVIILSFLFLLCSTNADSHYSMWHDSHCYLLIHCHESPTSVTLPLLLCISLYPAISLWRKVPRGNAT